MPPKISPFWITLFAVSLCILYLKFSYLTRTSSCKIFKGNCLYQKYKYYNGSDPDRHFDVVCVIVVGTRLHVTGHFNVDNWCSAIINIIFRFMAGLNCLAKEIVLFYFMTISRDMDCLVIYALNFEDMNLISFANLLEYI